MDEQQPETGARRISPMQQLRMVLGLISGVLFVSAAIWIRSPVAAVRLGLLAVAALVIGAMAPRSA